MSTDDICDMEEFPQAEAGMIGENENLSVQGARARQVVSGSIEQVTQAIVDRPARLHPRNGQGACQSIRVRHDDRVR